MAERKTSTDTGDQDAQNDGTRPQGPVPDPIPQDQAGRATPMLTQADMALAREQDFNAARLRADDAARAEAPTVRMVCVTPFTIVDDKSPRGRLVAVGEEMDVSSYDLDAYTGRMRPKADPLSPDRLDGPVVSRT